MAKGKTRRQMCHSWSKIYQKIEMEAEMLGYKSVNFFCPLVYRVFFKKLMKKKKKKRGF
jgi:hypothetical protein